MLLLTTALVLAVTTIGPASPQPPPDPDADERARVGTTNEYVYIDGESLEGEVLRAEGAPVRGRLGIRHRNLITLRGEFTDYLTRLSREI